MDERKHQGRDTDEDGNRQEQAPDKEGDHQ
jgi:hypothetical protein